MANDTSPQGWYLDPTGQGVSRYWNGVSWTQAVNRGDMILNIAIDPVLAQTPPGPGTQVTAPIMQAPAPQPAAASPSDNSVMGVIFGVLAVFFLILMVVAIVNSDSADEPPTIDVSVPAATVAPTPEATAPEASTDTTGG